MKGRILILVCAALVSSSPLSDMVAEEEADTRQHRDNHKDQQGRNSRQHLRKIYLKKQKHEAAERERAEQEQQKKLAEAKERTQFLVERKNGYRLAPSPKYCNECLLQGSPCKSFNGGQVSCLTRPPQGCPSLSCDCSQNKVCSNVDVPPWEAISPTTSPTRLPTPSSQIYSHHKRLNEDVSRQKMEAMLHDLRQELTKRDAELSNVEHQLHKLHGRVWGSAP